MRLLLDTHIWVWSLIEPDRLTEDVRAALTNREAELWLSAISVWEVLILLRKGRLRVKSRDGATWVSEALKGSPLREAAITHQIAMESERLTMQHWDPADRFIAATARVLKATLVTADERLIAATGFNVLANR
jgi:PIN domain nuclease of toxin-antitoxin system